MKRLRGGAGGCGRRAVPSVAVPSAVGAVVALLLVTGCEAPDVGGPAAGSTPTASDGRAVGPLANPEGTKPGLAPLTSAEDKSKARALIEKVATKGRGPKTGYDRDKFGYAWMDSVDGVPLAHNGCDTRNDLIKRDGQDLRFKAGSDCVVISMTLDDPYTGTTIEWRKTQATKVQIDHVMPLSYDWQMGASRWSKAKREQIANDPLNLLPVSGSTNGSKSDSGPAAWLPPNKQIRCSYAVRFAQVSLKYELPVTTADKQMMLRQCGGA